MPWYSDEELWSEFYSFIFPSSYFLSAKEDARFLVEHENIRGGTVLDLACGPGRHAVAFAALGFNVVGVDTSAFLLSKATDYARAEKVDVTFIAEDMRNFVHPNFFDLALFLYSSFGYLESRDDDKSVLRRLYENLKVSGAVVIDLKPKELILMDHQEHQVINLGNGIVINERQKLNADRNSLQTEWTMTRDNKVFSKSLKINLYHSEELVEMLEDVGFYNLKLYEDYRFTPYGDKAKRLIAIGRKG